MLGNDFWVGDYTIAVRPASPHEGVVQPTPEGPETPATVPTPITVQEAEGPETLPTPAPTVPTDEQGFVVPKAYGLSSVLELHGAVVCAVSGSQGELSLSHFAERNNLDITPLTFDDIETVLAAYLTEQCDAATAKRSQLASLVNSIAPDPGAHLILPFEAAPMPTRAPATTPTPTPAASGSDSRDINLTYLCWRDRSRSCDDLQEFFDAVRTRTGGQINFSNLHDDLGTIREPTTYIASLSGGHFNLGEVIPGDILPYPDEVNRWEASASPGDRAGLTEALRQVELRHVDLKVVGLVFHSDVYMFSKKQVSLLADFEEMKVAIQAGPLAYQLFAEILQSQDVSEIILTDFSSVNWALEDGDVDASITCAACGVSREWYEFTDYVVGPVPGLRNHSALAIDRQAWDNLPENIQAIVEEEGIAHTHRELAKTRERDSAALQELTGFGMSYSELPRDVQREIGKLIDRMVN